MPEVSDQPAVVLQVCAGEPGGRGAALECLNDAGELAVVNEAAAPRTRKAANITRARLCPNGVCGGNQSEIAVALAGDATDVSAAGHCSTECKAR